MPTRPKQKGQDHIDDAQRVLKVAKKRLPEFKKADKNRTIKTIDDSFIQQYEGDISAASQALGGQEVTRVTAGANTNTEESQRAIVHELITSIRDDVAISYRSDTATQNVFGRGQKILAHSTQSLLKVAGFLLEAGKDPDKAAKAAAAGVTAARFAKLEAERDKLQAADTTQNAHQGTAKGKTIQKTNLLVAVKRATTFVRKVAKVVFKKQPEVLAEFQSTIPRRVPKKRVPGTPAVTARGKKGKAGAGTTATATANTAAASQKQIASG